MGGIWGFDGGERVVVLAFVAMLRRTLFGLQFSPVKGSKQLTFG
ncbi:MAG: hypothetical protein U0894_13710 [Pirellulales bacterium]